ncbi:PilC/PilY family type IV pilus protein [Shewanella sp. A32]|uniref:pilus assembly protein n=1 Tax=Shewanella sp. A32 TaxID=3031327 RepID=UPI0023BA1398|nr:PilC/PilY family type IV pilus protein [Shewanella sp. A32]MDF0534462.1 PilC/PilY family type IV pilus protein [Shewanella sp. A32]
MKLKQMICTFFIALVVISGVSLADDTDLYLIAPINNGKSKVLIIFDNSASMGTLETEIKGSYNPDETYPPLGSSNSYQSNMIYATVGTGTDNMPLPNPDSPSDSTRFNALLNGCAAAKDALATYGRFTGYIREYYSSGKYRGTWQPLANNSGANTNNPVECFEDIESVNASNNESVTGYGDGFPQNNVSTGGKNSTYLPWGNPLTQDLSGLFSSGPLVTLYTDNYLRWYHGTNTGAVNVTRLSLAKEAISGVINSMSAVDFGLAVFNLDYPNEGDRDGGRIIAGIRSRNTSEKQTLIDTIEGLPAETNTPLCETLFEAYSYFSGNPVTFAHNDSNYSDLNYKGNKPPYDTSIESNGRYVSPMNNCSDIAYIIYITDGEPTLDASADQEIINLVGSRSLNTTQDKKTDNGVYSPYTYGYDKYDHALKSYMPALASYMYWHDQVLSTDTFQQVKTFTIGFALDEDSVAEPLLIETAKRGGGKYYAANNVTSLQSAISNALDQITYEGQRFSAPGVAYSNADPTRTLDSAYYALFEPNHGPRWAGNLKKFKVNSTGTLVDANGNNAISITGGIKETACSFWSSCSPDPDGFYVEEGGAARQIDPEHRNLLSNIGTSGALSSLNKSSASSYIGGDTNLFSFMNMVEDTSSTVSAQLDKAFEWIKGFNVDVDSDGSPMSTDYDGIRGDIMGDPMHSQPLAIDYGDTKGVYIFVGTNEGMFHAFKDAGDSVSERWAFMPFDMLANIQTLRDNNYSNGHGVYGIDGSPVSYIKRASDGSIEKAWLFVGLRRGGNSYYALDVTVPDTPRLMWHIDSTSTGFSELGQTWSTPVVTKVPGIDSPVIIFGGGYNIGYDAGSGSNSLGRDVYIVDAETGELKYTFGVGGQTALPGISDSIAGSIALLDSNSDGITDRMYAADLGGNVWRIDMPSTDTASWSGFKFASLGGTLSNNRRFFYEPVVAQTEFTNVTTVTYTDSSGNTTSTVASQNVPYDAVTLGSGDRASPLGTTTEDMFFVLQDRNVVTKSFGTGGATIPDAIELTNLYDVTSSAPTTDSDNLAFGAKLGWYFNFSGVGEKSLSPSTILKGKVYFTSFTPSLDDPQNTCQISSEGRLYIFDLNNGGRSSQEYIDVCEDCIPQPPKLITPPLSDDSDNPPLSLIIGKGNCVDGQCSGTVNLDLGLTTNKIYYHVNEH